MDFRLTLCQINLEWENVTANLKRIGEMLAQHQEQSDVIVLPELFSTGFTMSVIQLAEGSEGQTMQWMKELASERGACITGSMIFRHEDRYYNRLIFMYPDGMWLSYDKRHLFRMSDEHKFYSQGKDRLIASLGDWRLCPMICYDLRFPVWSRYRKDYDLLVYIANWPKQRRDVWRTLIRARAIENHCYVAGVNRVGTDGTGISYCGDTMLVDYKGEIISEIKLASEEIRTVHLDWDALREFRLKFPVHLDADEFEIL